MSRTGSIPWADSASALPARGGGIQRIGLNQQRWTQAVEEVITNPVPEVKDAALELPEPTPNGNAALVSKLVIPKEHIALLVSELDLTNKEAEETLRKSGGDVQIALLQLTTPTID